MSTEADIVEYLKETMASSEFPALPLESHGIDAHRTEWATDASGKRRVLDGGDNAYGWLGFYVEMINAVPSLMTEITNLRAERDAAARDMRERCAKVAEDEAARWGKKDGSSALVAARMIRDLPESAAPTGTVIATEKDAAT